MKIITRPQQVKIQTLRHQLFGADDGKYREMLGGFKVGSSKELSFARAGMVIEHLEECLGKGAASREPGAVKAKSKARAGRASEEQLFEIRRRWGLLSVAAPHEREGALRKFLKRRFRVAAPEWLSLPQAQKVLNALKAMKQRGSKQRAASS
jgi:hypothetical protein